MTGTLWHVALAILVFLASHSLTVLPRIRRCGEAALGRVGFTLAYSALSLALLTWLIVAVKDAPTVVLWTQEPWMRLMPLALMLPACLLAAAGLSTANPFSIGPGGRGYDPARPGILRLTSHPVVWALALWAGAHMIPNGTAAAQMLFAPMLGLALAGPLLLDSKRRKSLGQEEWARLAAPTGNPSAWPQALAETGWMRLLAGGAVYALMLALHPLVIGLSPLP